MSDQKFTEGEWIWDYADDAIDILASDDISQKGRTIHGELEMKHRISKINFHAAENALAIAHGPKAISPIG